MRLCGLHVYPVKSLRGIQLESAHATVRGIDLDRQWMLVDRAGRVVTQIEQPRMSLINVAIESDALRIDAPAMPALHIPLARQTTIARDVKLFRRPRRALPVCPDADRWFTDFLGTPCTLVQNLADEVRSFANQRPFHVITAASWWDLNARLHAAIPLGRFRPNFIVAGAMPYEEDGWTSIRIGDLSFQALEVTERCAVTTVDSVSGTRGIEPLRALSKYRVAVTLTGRHVRFGRYLALDHDHAGTIRLGDKVTLAGTRE